MGNPQPENRGWTPRPVAARAVRAAQIILPFVAGWLAIRGLSPLFFGREQAGWVAFVTWLVQAIFVATVVSAAVARLVTRLTPLVALLNMSLVFPDSTPSRFGLALRSGTVKKLMAAPSLRLSTSAQAAAEEAVQLVTYLGRHEPLTRGHTERVRAYADVIGQQMGLSEEDLDGLRWGALLHDVGKLTVPAEILNKPGKPTAQEWEVLRRHPAAAVPILEPLEGWLGDWLLAAPQHHERFDGTGYPAGLSGREISLGGRITAVADAFDVITSRRSYKEPKSAEFAREELVSSAGSHFDPVVVRALLEAGVTQTAYARRMGWLLEIPAIARAFTAAGQIAIATVVAVAISVGASTNGPAENAGSSEIPEGLAFVERDNERALAITGGREVREAVGPFESVSVEVINEDPREADIDAEPLSSETTTTVPADEDPEQASSSTSTSPQSVPRQDTVPTTEPRAVTPATTAPRPATTVAPTVTRPAATPTTRPVTTTTTTIPPTTDCVALLAGETFLPNADLRGCDLSNRTFNGLDLSGANLQRANLTGATLADFNLQGANLRAATFTDALLTRGSLRDAVFAGVAGQRLSATQVGFEGANLQGTNLAGSRYVSSSFQGANVRGVNFAGASFEDSDFRDANVRGVDFSGLDLRGTNFSNATIGNTNLASADLSETNFTNASGVPASWSAATFRFTTCPDGTISDVSCWK